MIHFEQTFTNSKQKNHDSVATLWQSFPYMTWITLIDWRSCNEIPISSWYCDSVTRLDTLL